MKPFDHSQSKNIVCAFFCIFVYLVSVKAQTFSILPANTQTFTVTCDSAFGTRIYISNPDSHDLDLSYSFLSNTFPSAECWSYLFCDWERCLVWPPQGTVGHNAKIPANSKHFLLVELDITSYNTKGQGSFSFKLFQTSNPSNFQIITWNVIGCSTGDECTAAGISEPANNTDFAVYPNPAEDFIHVDIPAGFTLGGSIEVYNLTGEKLITVNEIQHKIQKVDLHELPAGAYFIKYNSAKGALVKKIFKAK